MTSPELVSGFLDWYLAANPAYANLAGAQGYDRTLGDFTESGILAREREARRWLERLQEVRTPGSAGGRRKPGEPRWPRSPRGARELRGRDRPGAGHVHAARRDRVRGVAHLAA
ncbi:hypothetical protein [Streptosporangium vulgare]|uniref:hypothetical protein n=1 Tax=Streptosporangium vulgare TaxID=46190 RepID=UPI0031E33D3B